VFILSALQATSSFNLSDWMLVPNALEANWLLSLLACSQLLLLLLHY
jgi:hypothetical protein